MPLKLELELSDKDLDYFRTVIVETWERNAKREEKEILEGVRRLLQEAQDSQVPDYVSKRLADLGTMLSLLEDKEWPLEEKYRERILAAISYFAEPDDLIPDKIPGLGFLDDALMAEIVMEELKHELDGYREFCEFRKSRESTHGKDAKVSREDWLADRRRQLRYRIERRMRERRMRHSSSYGATNPILNFFSEPY